jgi:hypothetical protein
MTTTPYQGQPVVYVLSEYDAADIKAKRAEAGIGGNSPGAGDRCPAVIVKLWGPTYANLAVTLDGHDTFWATSRNLDASGEPGTWFIPAQPAAPAAEGE